MLITVCILSLFTSISLALNIYQHRKSKKPVKAPKSVEAEDLLHDLTRGPALVKITVIDPSDLMIRSPK